ncbi:amphoterin-induced protein 1-like [Acyrthosiphon pisum]|uniref:LRRNT domain-containing protein n=1 Tax=Acyrthosiphon pisum TaxID=7029 RepID=A0A8R2D4T3_ACYPI|nr:amphoterin-induced protein 1-like [Acyrthosiphon pisum]|eukprot:XP_016660556.1 PREDICTED: amphoterin-induced protein 1-like [Acyrthosiphon pisum]
MTRPMHQDAAAAAVLRRTIMVLLLSLLMFSLSSFPSVTAECPDGCTCKQEDGVYCHKLELKRIPDRIPPVTELLDLSYNEIRDIESLTHLTEIQFLDLSYNEIRDIESLANLTELQFLDLNHNEIRDIESLAHLIELETLMLSNNNISEVKNGEFANISKLQTLYLLG